MQLAVSSRCDFRLIAIGDRNNMPAALMPKGEKNNVMTVRGELRELK